MRNKLILLALVVVTTANVGCCARRCKWLHRGSPCGTTVVAQPAVCAPVPVSVPVAAPQAAPAMVPAMAPAPMQQVVVPQPIYCCPQPVCPQPVCPQPQPCCPPCQVDPCQSGFMPGMSGGQFPGGMMAPCDCGEVTTYDKGYLVPGTETLLDSGSLDADPAPVQEN